MGEFLSNDGTYSTLVMDLGVAETLREIFIDELSDFLTMEEGEFIETASPTGRPTSASANVFRAELDFTVSTALLPENINTPDLTSEQLDALTERIMEAFGHHQGCFVP